MAWTRSYDGAEPQRLNKWLAGLGLCSRREAEALIAAGRVRLNGAVVTEPGAKAAPGDVVSVAIDAGADAETVFTAVVHKPVGLVSAQPEPGQTPAARLLTGDRLWGGARVAPPGRGARLAPLGRLDRDSRGLLLLSQDGVLAKAVIGPQSALDKEYRVRVSAPVSARGLALLRHGLELDGRRLKPAIVEPTGERALRFVLREGRNRQIRRMCEAVGVEVTDLWRVRIGPLALGDLPEGRWRPLGADERAALIAAAR